MSILSLSRTLQWVSIQTICNQAFALGQGFDRHLLGLKITAERLNRPLPAIFQSEVYKYMSQFVLSTSTLTTETIVFGGFGPVVKDGFGIGYNVVGSKLGAVISGHKVGFLTDKSSSPMFF